MERKEEKVEKRGGYLTNRAENRFRPLLSIGAGFPYLLCDINVKRGLRNLQMEVNAHLNIGKQLVNISPKVIVTLLHDLGNIIIKLNKAGLGC